MDIRQWEKVLVLFVLSWPCVFDNLRTIQQVYHHHNNNRHRARFLLPFMSLTNQEHIPGRKGHPSLSYHTFPLSYTDQVHSTAPMGLPEQL